MFKSLLERIHPHIFDNIENIYVIGCNSWKERRAILTSLPNLRNVYLFEPSIHWVSNLRNKITDSRIKILNCALSNTTGTQEFHVASNGGLSSSLLKLDKHKTLFPHVSYINDILVEVYTIPDIIQKENLVPPDMLYIDAQGSEYDILSAIPDSILENITIIYTEVSTIDDMWEGNKTLDDIKELLSGHFDFLGFKNFKSTSKHGDAIFLNRDRNTEILTWQ